VRPQSGLTAANPACYTGTISNDGHGWARHGKGSSPQPRNLIKVLSYLSKRANRLKSDAGLSEEAVFEALGMRWIDPSERNGAIEAQAAVKARTRRNASAPARSARFAHPSGESGAPAEAAE